MTSAPVLEPPVVAPPRAHGGGEPPPIDRGGGDDGGGGDGPQDPAGGDDLPISGPKLAMAFVLFSLSVLFVVTCFGALLLRRQKAWHPEVAPAFPPILWANTLVLIASSATLRRAMRPEGSLTRGLGATWLLGGVFLAGQSWAWHRLAAQGVTIGTGSYGTVFYWLTGLHAAHVLGGLVSLGWCSLRAARGGYAAERTGVELCELYWHFLGAVWLVLVALLFVML